MLMVSGFHAGDFRLGLGKTMDAELYFRPGITKQGYWTNIHAKLQLEDVTDCLIYVFPYFEFVILFDQSSGYKKLREDGLNVTNTNVSYGDVITVIHKTTIEDIGPYPATLAIDEAELIVFDDNHPGPF